MGSIAESYRGQENKRLILLMERRGYTRKTLAEAAGVHERTIYDICKGNLFPRLDTLMCICETLKVSMDEIYPIIL